MRTSCAIGSSSTTVTVIALGSGSNLMNRLGPKESDRPGFPEIRLQRRNGPSVCVEIQLNSCSPSIQHWKVLVYPIPTKQGIPGASLTFCEPNPTGDQVLV